MDRKKYYRIILKIPLILGLILALAGWQRLSFSVTAQAGDGYSIRFYGNGYGDIDRIKIPIKAKQPNNVGSADFTIEWWMKANPGENLSTVRCNENDGWIYGNILFDRDVWGEGDYGDFGIALNEGRIAFGVNNGRGGNTLCGSSNVADGRWHHVAVTRAIDNGTLAIFVDGALDAIGEGPVGDISYRVGRSTQYPDDPFLVIGAEKHDAGPEYPSYRGWVDEVRVSSVLRYTTSFLLTKAPFEVDSATLALFHFDEGPEGPCTGALKDELGVNEAFCQFGGGAEQGPVFVEDNPFTKPVDATASSTQAPPTITSPFLPEITATFVATSTVQVVRSESVIGTPAAVVPSQTSPVITDTQLSSQQTARPSGYLIIIIVTLLAGVGVLLVRFLRRK